MNSPLAGRESPEASASLVALRRCSLTLGKTDVLADLTLDVRRGEFLALVGPSGCGKSTILRLLLGLLATPSRGEVTRQSPSPATGIVFQRPTLLPWRTTYANVELFLCIGPRRLTSPNARATRVREALALIGLGTFAEHYPHELSGGMQQRVAIARALVTRPSLLLMDEPFGALDELTRVILNREVLRLWEANETPLETIVLVTHSISEALLMADRVVVLSGRPARVAASFELGFAKPRSELFATIESSAPFRDARRAIRAALGVS